MSAAPSFCPTNREVAETSAGACPAAPDLELALDQYRRPLTRHCYRMLGCRFEAENAVQETLIRAWRSFDRFEARSTLHSWLYRIATNVCLDMLRASARRALPVDPVECAPAAPTATDPAELAVSRESVRLAFVAALAHLPPRQRAVLILREVLRWQAAEVAELLGTSVAAVNSALQRARATLAARDVDTSTMNPDAERVSLSQRCVSAFERHDATSLVSLLYEDARRRSRTSPARTSGAHPQRPGIHAFGLLGDAAPTAPCPPASPAHSLSAHAQ
ncbi:MAG: sigma-70 family RNA polymerase sigma factor [Acidimicrobiales bacterium]